jgi:ADP-heptose:LPS heptosyltransferase
MLVAAPLRWDEACFAVPAVRALMASGLGVGVLCSEPQAEFWKTLKGLEVVVIPAKAKPKAVAESIRGHWQAALVWEPGPAADAIQLARVPQRVGPEHPKLQKLLSHPLRFKVEPLEHRVRFYLAAIEEMGVATKRPEFFAPASTVAPKIPGTVLVCPDSDFGPSHEWLLPRWVELSRSLSLDPARTTVIGLPASRGLSKSLAAHLGKNARFFPDTQLGKSLEMIAGHPWVIAADGSLPHLAAHLGATCATLFGPNDPAWKRPLGKRHAVLHRHVECAPCLLPKCPLDSRCQQELDTDRLVEIIRGMTSASS